MGDNSDMTTGDARRLGDRIARELYRDPDYLDDAVLTEYVQGIWQPLPAAARMRGEITPEIDERFAWEILLSRDRAINAFARPGGYLGVFLGLIGLVSTRDELASVLAHELSHVTQRHIQRLMTRQSRQMPLMLASMILGALAASRSPQAANALIVGGQAAAMQSQLNFSRDMEREADRIGYGVATQAGFAPEGFVSMFDKLQQASRINDNSSFPYLRNHPLTTERMADMQSRAHFHAPGAGASNGAPTLEHALVAARARVLSDVGVDTLRSWAAEPDGSSFASQPQARRAAVLYAAALAASRQRDPAAARRHVARLLPEVQADSAAARQAYLLGAEIDLAAGDPAAALARLPVGRAKQRPELTLSTQALLGLKRGGEAVAPLQTWVAEHPRDAGAWMLLAGACQAAGQPLRAIRAEAESHAAHLDFAAAVDRFKAGQDLSRRLGTAGGDYIEASIIDTRLRETQSRLREQASERSLD
nr:M48 family metalloprotease [Xylophilus sp.]